VAVVSQPSKKQIMRKIYSQKERLCQI